MLFILYLLGMGFTYPFVSKGINVAQAFDQEEFGKILIITLSLIFWPLYWMAYWAEKKFFND
jgi:hypothetical protein